MTGNDEDASMIAVEKGRKLGRLLVAKLQEVGVSREDATLAALYSAFDAAQDFRGDGVLAVEWLRTGLDVIERDVMNGRTVQ